MRHAPFDDDSNTTAPTSWRELKEQGNNHFRNGEYENALQSYRNALHPQFEAPRIERQMILSNIVACRLKLGGPAQARAALSDAKDCISQNDQWAKGHLRLAEAYIALGDRSNDACNALQRVLSLDPSNAHARQMLVRELRRRDRTAAPSAPPQDQDAPPPQDAPSALPQDRDAPPQDATPQDHDTAPFHTSIDDNISWTDRVKFWFASCLSWYYDQSDDVQTLLKVMAAILFLYVAFGGRFGLTCLFGNNNKNNNLGNYDSGNAYERYRKYGGYYNNDRSHGGYNDRSSYNSRSSYDRGYDRSSYDRGYDRSSYGSRGSYNNYGYWSSFDGSTLPSLAIVGGVLYLCHRNGINPFHALLMMNMMRGGRRRPFGGFGMGGGMGGFGMGGGMGGRYRRRWY